MLKKQIQVATADGAIEECTVAYRDTPPLELHLSWPPLGDDRVYVAEDLFECLRKARLDLEAIGAQIICQGARVDVYPSPMCRDMGFGRLAYVMKMGEKATSDDLVHVMDSASPSDVGTVAAQDAYYRRWIQSIGAGALFGSGKGRSRIWRLLRDRLLPRRTRRG